MKIKQRIFILDGPDQCGKSEISQHLAKTLKIPYFKNSIDKKAFANDDENYFQNCMRYAEPFWLSYLEQSKTSVVMDRGYLSEAVYSKVFSRETDHDLIMKLDEMYSKLNTYIVFCFRSSYTGWYDDFDPKRIDSKTLWKLDSEYRLFLNTTKCRVINLCVDSHNLNEQTNVILDLVKRHER